MKTRLIFLALALASTVACAEWTQLGTANHGSTSYYLDLTTQQKSADGKVRIAYLLDMKKPDQVDSNAYLSTRGESEFDCKATTYRTVSLSRHSENMASGRLVAVVSEPDEWSRIPPHSKVARMFSTVCGKKVTKAIDARDRVSCMRAFSRN
jgi:hypothetical protein